MRKEVIPLRIAIYDDDLHWRRQILELTNAYATENPEYCISFTAFEWGSELMDAARKTGGFDVYILDILMHGMNGIELGSRLRQMGFDGKIIYMSSSQDYALEAFKVKACNYLLKPLSKDSFFAAPDDVYNAIAERKNKSIIVRTKESSIKVSFDSIEYAELCKRTVVYHLVSGRVLESISIRTSFSDAIHELLTDKRFILCGTSMVANMHHITMVEKDGLLFRNCRKVYLPRKACSDIRSAWYDFYFEEEGGL